MSLSNLVSRIRAEHPEKNISAFDPRNGNEKAKILFIFEAPGARAVKTGVISFENPDPTARNFRKQLEEAKIEREEIAIWNTVPWYIGNAKGTSIRAARAEDVRSGIEYLAPIVQLLPEVRYICLVGGAARRAHIFLSRRVNARIVSCHHTSAKVMNVNPLAWNENLDVFRMMKVGIGH